MGLAPRWTPAKLGSAARFIARADHATVSGSNITSLANAGGSAGAMTSPGSNYCTLDATVLQGGQSAIRTSAYTSDLRVLTGGPTGTTPLHMVALAQRISQPGAGQNNSDFMISGDPGNDGSHKNFGVGVVAASNGAWDLVGGFQNSSQAGNAATFPNGAFDTAVHLFEGIADGTQILLNRDGGKTVFFAGGSTTLSSGRMGFSGIYPLSIYGPPDTRIFWAGWFDRVLTTPERVSLLKYLAHEFAFRPQRFIAATGDSITAGHVVTANTSSFLEQLKSQYAALSTPETICIFNQGISSQTSAQISARSPSTFADAFSPLGANFRDQWLVINGGKNDNQATETPAQCYANLAAISVAAQALGVRTVMTTAFYGTPVAMTPSNYAWVDAVNALIRANSCGADFVGDYYLDPILASPQVAHFPDNVHPDNVALAAMATILRGIIG
jgi:hypothetical protein